MAPVTARTLLDEVSVTHARNTISPVFDRAVRDKHPTLIRRGRDEYGLLLDRSLALALLSGCNMHVDVIPEDEGGFTLWLNELEVGGSGKDLYSARQDLLAHIRYYVRDYLDDLPFNLRIPNRVEQFGYVLRLSLATSDDELIEMLFGPEEGDAVA